VNGFYTKAVQVILLPAPACMPVPALVLYILAKCIISHNLLALLYNRGLFTHVFIIYLFIHLLKFSTQSSKWEVYYRVINHEFTEVRDHAQIWSPLVIFGGNNEKNINSQGAVGKQTKK
jgi:hypothetical protein